MPAPHHLCGETSTDGDLKGDVMATVCLICDTDAKQSDVDTIKGWLVENGHEVVYSDTREPVHGHYVQIGGDYAVVRAGGVRSFFGDVPKTEIGDEVSIRFRFGDENLFIEQSLDFLSKHL